MPDTLIGFLFHVQYDFPKSCPKTGKLYAFQPYRKVQPHSEEHRQHDWTEQESAQISQNFTDDRFHFLFSFAKK